MGSVGVFRCKVCHESYIGEEPPSRCPFCGAPERYLIPAEDWDWSEFKVEISDVSKVNLKAALKLELDNTSFYLCAMNAAQKVADEYGYAKFKALKRVENEHAEAISKALQIEEPSLDDIPCSSDFKDNTQEGWEREDRAIKAYSKFAAKATEPVPLQRGQTPPSPRRWPRTLLLCRLCPAAVPRIQSPRTTPAARARRQRVIAEEYGLNPFFVFG